MGRAFGSNIPDGSRYEMAFCQLNKHSETMQSYKMKILNKNDI